MATAPQPAKTPFQLQEGEKFACIGLYVPFLSARIPKYVDSDLTLFGKQEAWIEDHWKEWLGSLRVKNVNGANLFIVAHAPSDKPDIIDAEHDDLMSKALAMFSGLVLTDVKLTAPAYLKGSYYKGKTEIRQFVEAIAHVRVEDHPWTVLHDARLQNAVDVRNGLLSLSGRPTEFLRFKRGLRSVSQALQAEVVDERAFYFARALEALHVSKKGEGRGDFVSKCAMISGSTPRYTEFFGDLYDTRNNYVHANDFHQLLKAGEDLASANARLATEAIDAQLLVLEIYRTILCDPKLLDQFKDDDSSSALWASEWSTSITTEAIRAARIDEVEALANHS